MLEIVKKLNRVICSTFSRAIKKNSKHGQKINFKNVIKRFEKNFK